MNCYIHPDTVAVGSCKNCSKGVCTGCSIDSGVGLACCTQCQEKVKQLSVMLARNQRSYAFAARTHSRNAIWLALMAVLLLTFGLLGELKAYSIWMGLIMMLGAVFSWLNSRRL